MTGIVITKVEISPKNVNTGNEFKIAVFAYPITNGAGERKLPFRLRTKDLDSLNSNN